MHSLSESSDGVMPEPLQVICHLSTFIAEGRLPLHRLQSSIDSSELIGNKPRPYYEGFHCPKLVGGVPKEGFHRCQERSSLCIRFHKLRNLLQKLGTSVVVETYLAPDCFCANLRSESTLVSTPAKPEDVLLEQWKFSVSGNVRPQDKGIALGVLYQALRSSLHFSQLSAWYVQNNGKKPAHIVYRVCHIRDAALPRGAMEQHIFPVAEINRNTLIKVAVLTLPRMDEMPVPKCFTHSKDGKGQNGLHDKYRSHLLPSNFGFKFDKKGETLERCEKLKKTRGFTGIENSDILDGLALGGVPKKSMKEYYSTMEATHVTVGTNLVQHMTTTCPIKSKLGLKVSGGKEPTPDLQLPSVLDDRMHIMCRVSGKHHCEYTLDEEQEQASAEMDRGRERRRRSVSRLMTSDDVEPEGSSKSGHWKRILHGKFKEVHQESELPSVSVCGNQFSVTFDSEYKSFWQSIKNSRDTAVASNQPERPQCHNAYDVASLAVSEAKVDMNPFLAAILRCAQTRVQSARIRDASTNTDISLRPDEVYVGQHVCHSTAMDDCDDISSPVLGKVNQTTSTERYSPSADNSVVDDAQCEDGCSKSPVTLVSGSRRFPGLLAFGSQFDGRRTLPSLPLLGSFEESALRGRLEPVSTVTGFTAELGASGSFFPPHLQLPVTVSFFSTQNHFSGSSPYLGHMSLDKKGYNVPRSGTIQVTLFNPQKTVVNMFVVQYDLEDMPPKSCTFLRQRTFCVTTTRTNADGDSAKIGLRTSTKYLIHLRFSSGKTGKIYLHTDVRFLIFSKADANTASVIRLHGEPQISYKLFTQNFSPSNPKYSLNSRKY